MNSLQKIKPKNTAVTLFNGALFMMNLPIFVQSVSAGNVYYTLFTGIIEAALAWFTYCSWTGRNYFRTRD